MKILTFTIILFLLWSELALARQYSDEDQDDVSEEDEMNADLDDVTKVISSTLLKKLDDDGKI
jgi:hypothetical protein